MQRPAWGLGTSVALLGGPGLWQGGLALPAKGHDWTQTGSPALHSCLKVLQVVDDGSLGHGSTPVAGSMLGVAVASPAETGVIP